MVFFMCCLSDFIPFCSSCRSYLRSFLLLTSEAHSMRQIETSTRTQCAITEMLLELDKSERPTMFQSDHLLQEKDVDDSLFCNEAANNISRCARGQVVTTDESAILKRHRLADTCGHVYMGLSVLCCMS